MLYKDMYKTQTNGALVLTCSVTLILYCVPHSLTVELDNWLIYENTTTTTSTTTTTTTTTFYVLDLQLF